MRLSDYMKGGQQPAKSVFPTVNPAPPPVSPEVALTDSGIEYRKELKRSALDRPTGYDSAQTGILEAAAQLGISIPKPKETITERSVKCLSMVFEKVETEAEGEPEAVWAMIQSVAAELEEISRGGKSFIPQYEPQKKEDRLLWHSVYTAVFAMEIAVAVDGLDTSVTDIGAAALLHDAGFLRMKDGLERCMHEFDLRNAEHVEQSVCIVREIGAPIEIIRMIGQHHERCDGNGFPNHFTGEQIGRSSQILGIANVLETSLERSAFADSDDIPSIFDVLVEWRKAFDHDLLKSVLSRKGFYSVGEMVELTNRSICQVMHLNPGFPLRPVVKVIVDGSGNHPDVSKLIDLKDVGVLSISRKIT